MSALVDVLVVMERHEQHERGVYLDQIGKYGHIKGLAGDLEKLKSNLDNATEARAAVAELVEAARAEIADYHSPETLSRLKAALVPFGGAA